MSVETLTQSVDLTQEIAMPETKVKGPTNQTVLKEPKLQTQGSLGSIGTVAPRFEGETIPQVKTYTYTKKCKDGTTKEVTVKRKYVNKIDRTNSLQNKEHKDTVIQNIIINRDKILALDSRKRVKFVKEFCLPPNVKCSYNTLRALLDKHLSVESS